MKATRPNYPQLVTEDWKSPDEPPLDGGGGGGDNGDMERRIVDLEKAVAGIEPRLRSMETDLAVVKSNYATKADVANAKNSIILWVVGTIILAQVLPALPSIVKGIMSALAP